MNRIQQAVTAYLKDALGIWAVADRTCLAGRYPLLAVAVEEEFDFRFDELPEFQTVGDICHYIEEHADGTANARP